MLPITAMHVSLLAAAGVALVAAIGIALLLARSSTAPELVADAS